MDYQFLKNRGALNETAAGARTQPAPPSTADGLLTSDIPPQVLELVPQSLARENIVIPLAFDGETITFAAAEPDDIALADKLRFILAKNVRLIPAAREAIIDAINRYYGETDVESVDSMLQEFTDTAIDFDVSGTPVPRAAAPASMAPAAGRGQIQFQKDLSEAGGSGNRAAATRAWMTHQRWGGPACSFTPSKKGSGS